MEYKSLSKLFLGAVFLFAVRLNAQVTIGSKVSPNAGSLLDLKEFDSELCDRG